MIKKVMLINPPNTICKDSVRRISEPIGLLYMAAMLKEKGFGIDVFDMTCEGYDNCNYDGNRVTYGSSLGELRERISRYSPDIIGVTCMFTSREKNTLDVCAAIKETAPDIPVVVGGLHPSLYPKTFIESGKVDYVILGEGERRIINLLNCLNRHKTPDFDGVAYKINDSVKINPIISAIEDLNVLPYPDRSLIDIEKYIAIGVPFAPFSREQRVAHVLTTRGCSNRCNFCSAVNYWGRKVRFRSVDNVIGELRELKDKFDIREIQFIDDNMTANKGFAKELFRKMKEFDFKFCAANGLFFNSLDAELIKLMAESGAYQLTFGIESGSKRVLNEIIHKNVQLDRVKEMIEEAHKYDISVHGVFIIGFPGERKEEIMSTLDFPFKVGFDSVSFFIASPIPGSELYKECEEKGYLGKDYSSLDFKTANIHIPKSSKDYFMDPDELVKLVDNKMHEFNEWAKKVYPERWEMKFSRYLRVHPEEKEVIMGRVT